MRLSYVRLPLLAATAWMGIGFSVWAMDIRYGETVFVTPTSTTFSLAPSYLVPRSYVTPTAYVVPSYYSTAYVVPSSLSTTYIAEPLSLLPTTYVATTYRRGLLGRRWLVERPVIASYGSAYFPSAYIASYGTSYIPSSYVLPTYYATSYRSRTYSPTVYEYPAVWETGAVIARRGDCDEVVSAPTLSSPSSGMTGPRASVSNNAPRIESREDPTIPSNVDTPPAAAGPRSLGSDAASAQNPAATRADTPPTPPNAGQDQAMPKNQQPTPPFRKPVEGAGDNSGTVRSTVEPAPKTKAAPPAAPGGEEKVPLLPAPGADNSETTIRRDAGKPVYAVRTLRPDQRRNVLIGRVETSGGDPQGVPVSVTSRSNNAIHHDGLTNAFGGFAIRLSDGEWTVNVTMPSGRVYPVRSITVSNGRVMDNQEGREVQNLIISY